MKKDRLTREEKIKFLQALANGEARITDIIPPTHVQLFFDQYDDGMYKDHQTGEVITQDQYKERIKPEPNKRKRIVKFKNFSGQKWLSTSPNIKIE